MTKQNCVHILIALALAAVSVNETRAVMLAAYDFENSDGLSSVDSDPNSVAGDIVGGPGLTIGNNTSRGETNVPPFVPGTNDQSLSFSQMNAAENSAALARAAGDYFTFTVDAAPFFFLDLEDLTFRTALSNVELDRTWTLDYALNGSSFVLDFDSGLFDGPQTTADNSPVWTPFAVDLSGPQFDNVASLTLRFIQHGETNTTHAVFFDKIALGGESLFVPEPSSLLLLSIGLAAVRRRARSRRTGRQN